MLAQNFKSAADLEISQPQLEALIKTLVLMETGEIKFVHLDEKSFESSVEGKSHEGLFNMNVWNAFTPCGTVCCIGGTAEYVGKVNFPGGCMEGMPEGLDRLFYPYELPDHQWNDITVEKGAQALRNYLTYGEPRWKEVMENKNV